MRRCLKRRIGMIFLPFGVSRAVFAAVPPSMRAAPTLLVLVLTGCNAIVGDAPLRPGAEDEALSCGPPPQRVWMLTNDQYRRTVESLYRAERGPVPDLTAEATRSYHGQNAAMLRLTTAQVASMLNGMQSIAAFIGDRLDGYVECDVASEGCFRDFIRGFAGRAWRAEPSDEQVDGLVAVYRVGRELSASDGFEAGVLAVLESPQFLFRTEIGEAQGDGTFRLSAHEVGTRLAYQVWGEPPDAQLWDRIESEEILQPAVYDRELDRLLADPRARRLAHSFAIEWTAAATLPSLTKDPALGAFSPAIGSAMREEIGRYAERAFFEGPRTIDELLRGETTIASSALSGYYGGAGEEWEEVDLSGTGRAGILTLPGVMAVHSQPDHVVPTTRGRFLLNQVLCVPLAPPPRIDPNLPAASPGLTPRERLAVMRDYPVCASCHNRADPIGFAFDHFDALGRRVEEVDGVAVDPSGAIVGTRESDGTFADLDQLLQRLADSPEVTACVQRRFYEFVDGRTTGPADECALHESAERVRAANGDLETLMRESLSSAHAFVRRRSR